MDTFGGRWLFGEIWWFTFLISLPLFLLGALFGLCLGRTFWGRFKRVWQKSEDECRALAERVASLEESKLKLEEESESGMAAVRQLEDARSLVERKHQDSLAELTRLKRAYAESGIALDSARSERDEQAALAQKFRQDCGALRQTSAKLGEVTAAWEEAEDRASRLEAELDLKRAVETEFLALRNDHDDLREELAELDDRLRQLTEERDEWRDAALRAEAELTRLEGEREPHEEPPAVVVPEEKSDDLPSVPLPAEAIAPLPSPDTLTKIERVSPELALQLQEEGLATFRSLALCEDDRWQALGEKLGFGDQWRLENWRQQAAVLHEEYHGEEIHVPGDNDAPPTDAAPTPQTATHDSLTEDPELGLVFQTPPSERDDLTQVKGIAEKLEHRLHDFGIYQYRQIAQWSDENMEAVARRLSFKDRIQKDQWREQCQHLHQSKYGEVLSP